DSSLSLKFPRLFSLSLQKETLVSDVAVRGDETFVLESFVETKTFSMGGGLLQPTYGVA
ncbi:hypothetical protein A2U01_0028744, partial [Trifolium medium]|nr:hypothetical protein [Trifolium medium]